ncbi:MAG: pitrilysin family protein [Planctomycetota bacterium]
MPSPAPTASVANAPKAKSLALPNGMVLVGEPSDRFRSAAITLMPPAGCRYDPVERLGLANLACEMALRGAGDRDSHQLVDDLDALGVERGESVGVSHTSFSASTLAENLPATLAIFADIARRPHLPAEQIDAGRQVCLQEVRGIEDEPAQKLMQALRLRHYGDPWGRASVGDESALRAMSIDEVRTFIAERYSPEGAILAVAGSFDWDTLCREVERLFGDWAASGADHESVQTPPQGDQHLPDETSQSHLGIAFPSTPYRDPDYFQAWGAVGVLSSGMSSRLFTEVREKRGLCYTVYASLQTQVDRAAVLCYAGTTAERAQETLDVTHAELLRLADGVQPEELARLKARLKSGLLLQQESTQARAGSLARDWRHLGRVRPIAEVEALVEAVTADSINAYLARNPPGDFTFVTLGPEPLRPSAAV